MSKSIIDLFFQGLAKSNRCTVFYECWQMECCGWEFKIGDEIKWIVCHCGDLSKDSGIAVNLGKVDYCYDAHDCNGTKFFTLTGTVERIQLLYQKYVLFPKYNPNVRIPVGGKLININQTKAFEKSIGEMKPTGYLVKISSYSIQPIK